jgi:DNA-binding response OmpR family regulator
VLLVDDERDLLDFGREVLTRAGYEVTAVATPDAALEAWRSRPYRLAVVDAHLAEDVTAEVLLRIARELRPEQPILVWSGAASAATAQSWGADGFLSKPCDATQLLAAVDATIASREGAWAAEPRPV